MDKREQKIIAQINSEIESGKNLRLYRFCIVSLLFGWTVLQNLYAGRFFAAAIIWMRKDSAYSPVWQLKKNSQK